MKTTLLLAIFLAGPAQAAVSLRSAGGEVSFLAVGRPSMLKIHGKAEGAEAKLSVDGASLNGSAEVPMDKFATGIALRDKHMKEKYLATAEHPRAKLTLKDVRVDPAFVESLNQPSAPFEGILSFHGKEQPVKGTFSAANGKVEAKFPLKLPDFGVEPPSYLGVTVAENVEVEVSLPLTKE